MRWPQIWSVTVRPDSPRLDGNCTGGDLIRLDAEGELHRQRPARSWRVVEQDAAPRERQNVRAEAVLDPALAEQTVDRNPMIYS